VAADKRDPRLPNVPTLKEQGIPFEAGYWIGLYGPKGLSGELASRIAADVAAAVNTEETRRSIDRAGMSITLSGPSEMRQQMLVEEKHYREAASFVKSN
jgi:tripartite-type tricarboxylate transporter receptor subunit TctC